MSPVKSVIYLLLLLLIIPAGWVGLAFYRVPELVSAPEFLSTAMIKGRSDNLLREIRRTAVIKDGHKYIARLVRKSEKARAARDYEGAVKPLIEAQTYGPDNWALYYTLGHVLAEASHAFRAEEKIRPATAMAAQSYGAYTRAIEINPLCGECYYDRAFIIKASAKFDDWEELEDEDFAKVIELELDSSDLYYSALLYRGRLAASQRKWEKARELYARAVEVNPEDWSAMFYLGCLQNNLGNPDSNKTWSAARGIAAGKEVEMSYMLLYENRENLCSFQ
ncbi:hypothetical protein FACS1894186_3800 [Alphaproteobacteria bacterium]|nr:hypothetical protein FACS1894186_3800 [Alphaproteobacteria bacterium]